MSIHDRAAMLMEPVAEIDEQILSDPKTPLSSTDEADREQSDIIKVKNVCRKLEFKSVAFKINCKSCPFSLTFLFSLQ